MTESRSLILAFIDRRPTAAARTLASMDPDDAVGLLEDIPTRHATRALIHMGAWSACALFTRMGASKAATILAGFPFQGAAALLRLMDREPRLAILQELPAPMRRDFRTTLAFPADTVGAHMTTSILTQRTDHTVADGRDQMRRAAKADTGCVIVVDEAHRLAGVVSPVTLLRSTANSSLSDVMDTDVRPISARARLTTVRDLEVWDRYQSLPVINRRAHVVGVLNQATLRHALASPGSEQTTVSPDLLSVLTDTFAGVLGGLSGLLERQPGGPPRSHERETRR